MLKRFQAFQKWEAAAEALQAAELRADTAEVAADHGQQQVAPVSHCVSCKSGVQCKKLKMKLHSISDGPQRGPVLSRVLHGNSEITS